MTRNLKALGLAMVAALALSAVAASAAHATNQEFTNANGNYPVSLHAGQTTQHVFTLQGGRKTECANATFTGSAAGPTKEITIAPTYSNCTVEIAGTKLPATITFPTTCDYVFTAPTTHVGVLVGQVHLVCTKKVPEEPEPDIEVHVYEQNASHHTPGLPPTGNERCTYTIKGGQTLTNLTYANQGGTKGVLVNANVTNVAYTRVLGTTTNCGAASSTATYTGSSTVTGTFEGAPQELHVE